MNRFSDPAMAFALSDKQFVAHVLATRERIDRPILVGLCGAQGSGKSTTSLRLRDLLVTAGRSTVVLSLDDFYLTCAERRELGDTTHRLLWTRGVPGTHDVTLATAVISDLLAADSAATTALPLFDKTTDDRTPRGLAVAPRPLRYHTAGRLVRLAHAPRPRSTSANRSTIWSGRRTEMEFGADM